MFKSVSQVNCQKSGNVSNVGFRWCQSVGLTQSYPGSVEWVVEAQNSTGRLAINVSGREVGLDPYAGESAGVVNKKGLILKTGNRQGTRRDRGESKTKTGY